MGKALIPAWSGGKDSAWGLPLYTVAVPARCSNAVYEAAMAGFVENATRDGVTQLAFGDLFLDDIRRYRERQFAKSGLELLFPLWGAPTRALAEEMIVGGLRARIVCVDLAQAPREWAGKTYGNPRSGEFGTRRVRLRRPGMRCIPCPGAA